MRDAQALTLPLTGSLGGPIGVPRRRGIVARRCIPRGPSSFEGGQPFTAIASPTPSAAVDARTDIGAAAAHEPAAVERSVPRRRHAAQARRGRHDRRRRARHAPHVQGQGRRHAHRASRRRYERLDDDRLVGNTDLKGPSSRPGWRLTIPPVNGLVVTVKPRTRSSRSRRRQDRRPRTILETNELDDPNLVVGQVLVMPGRQGRPDGPTPKPTKVAPKAPTSVRWPRQRRRTGAELHSRRSTFAWPVTGGGTTISQYFHYGHYGSTSPPTTAAGPRRGRRHGHLRRLEEQRRRLPGRGSPTAPASTRPTTTCRR